LTFIKDAEELGFINMFGFYPHQHR